MVNCVTELGNITTAEEKVLQLCSHQHLQTEMIIYSPDGCITRLNYMWNILVGTIQHKSANPEMLWVKS